MVVLTALFSTLNARLTRLPQSVGLTVLGAILSAAVIIASKLLPGLHIRHMARLFIDGLDFKRTLLDGMLSFLLFAGAFQVDLREMRRGRWPILALAVVGTILSTLIVGVCLHGVLKLTGHELSFAWCLVFGALISPTDPVAVLAILKDAYLPPAIQATVASESLFNDGVGVVLFTILLEIATGNADFDAGKALRLFAVEAGGGVAFGFCTGWLAYAAMRASEEYVVEVLVTLAAVMGGYAAAQAIGVSAPVAMAVAGLIVGNHGFANALTEMGQDYVVKFWEVVDEILNSVLFLLVGLEAVAIWRDNITMLVAAAAIPIVLVARLVSVGLPLLFLRRIRSLGRAAVPILWWGGLRGGVSIALALSIPREALGADGHELILAATYASVFFSVLVQGSTIGKLARRFRFEEEDEEREAAPAAGE